MAEAGFTLAQIHIHRLISGTASIEQRRLVADWLASRDLETRLLFALNTIARLDAKIPSYHWGAGDTAKFFVVKSELTPAEFIEKLHNAFGAAKKLPLPKFSEAVYWDFGNGMQFNITSPQKNTTRAIFLVKNDFIPFDV